MRVIASWSGGKDSCLALYLAAKSGCRVTRILNVVSKDTGRVAYQHIPREIVCSQAEALGIPLSQEEFAAAEEPQACDRQGLTLLGNFARMDGAAGVVSGHINPHDRQRGQMLRHCGDLGLKLIEPLSSRDPKVILDEFIEAGFHAIVVKVDTAVLSRSWLGRKIDRDFVSALEKIGSVDLCGDAGEYHSLVLDGPNFSRRLELKDSASVQGAGGYFLDIRAWRSVPKN